MSKLVILAKTLRLPNLALLALVQFLVSHYFLKNYNIQLLILISSATISIALAGYLLNDVLDLAIDKANSKLKFINEKNKNWALLSSVILMVLGVFLGYLSSRISSYSFFYYYIIASGILILYAFILSKFKILGNFVVAGLIVLAIYLAIFQQEPFVGGIKVTYKLIVLIFYGGFAFLLNWIREVIKDMEDFEGDKKEGRYSLPIVLGFGFSKFLITILLFGFINVFAFLSYQMFSNTLLLIYFLVLIALFMIIFFKVIIAESTKEFTTLSLLMKIVMFLGILLPIFV